MENHKPPLRTKTVLVVDDDLAVRVVVARMLQDEGYAVRMARQALPRRCSCWRLPQAPWT
jgi:CheY-like chemotaxis protein